MDASAHCDRAQAAARPNTKSHTHPIPDERATSGKCCCHTHHLQPGLRSQRIVQITVTPAPDLCVRFSGSSSAPVPFHVTISWTTGDGGSATITDSVTPYVIG